MTDSDSSEQWKKRRNVKKQKVYQCGCGKKYKSQGSLESHLKNSHDGVSPGPIKIPEKNSKGRPKIERSKANEQYEENLTNPFQYFTQKIDGWYSSQLNLKEIYEKEAVYNMIIRFLNPKQGEQLKFIQQDQIYEVSIGRGLLIMLSQLKEYIKQQDLLDQITLLITVYISYVIEETQDQSVLVNGNIGLLPEFVNYFLIYDVQRRFQRLKIKNIWINTIKNTTNILNILFRWLVYKKFSQTRAFINDQYPKPQQINNVDQSNEEQA